jgi:Bacterial regulatory proteins, gntR family
MVLANQADRESDAIERRELVRAIKRLLLTDRSPREGKDVPLRLVEDHALSERRLCDILGVSRIPIREALTVLRTVGVISVQADEKRYVVVLIYGPNGEHDSQLQNNVRFEAVNSARAAFSYFVKACPSADKRVTELEPLKRTLEEAKKQAGSTSLRDRGEAILLVTEALSRISSLVGLRWASGAVRSCLDIIEVSTRFQEARKHFFELESASVHDRIDDCSKVFTCLGASSNSDEKIIGEAQAAFETYVDNRLEKLQRCAAAPQKELKEARVWAMN